MTTPARAYVPHATRPIPVRGGSAPARQYSFSPTPGQLVALQNTHDRITPGVLGASYGGQGKSPDASWNRDFPLTPDGRVRPLDEPPAAAPAEGSDAGPQTVGVRPDAAAPFAAAAAARAAIAASLMGTPSAAAAGAAMLSQQRGTTPASGAPRPAGAPSVNPAVTPAAPDNAAGIYRAPLAVTNAAGTGIALQTGYGDGTPGSGMISSRIAAPGGNAATGGRSTPGMPNGQQAGVPHQNWQQAVLAAHPEIGIENSQANLAYRAAYADAVNHRGAGNFDPVMLSHQTMAPIYVSRMRPGDGATTMPPAGNDQSSREIASAKNAATQAQQLQAQREASTPEPGSLPDLASRGGTGAADAMTAAGAAVNNAEAAAGRFVSGSRDFQGPFNPNVADQGPVPGLDYAPVPGQGRQYARAMGLGTPGMNVDEAGLHAARTSDVVNSQPSPTPVASEKSYAANPNPLPPAQFPKPSWKPPTASTAQSSNQYAFDKTPVTPGSYQYPTGQQASGGQKSPSGADLYGPSYSFPDPGNGASASAKAASAGGDPMSAATPSWFMPSPTLSPANPQNGTGTANAQPPPTVNTASASTPAASQEEE